MVVGQASITNTLRNAIKTNQLAHAYLFCGPRGVGKTTCARIFAKTINCQNLKDNIEPCDTCESCTSFNKSTSFNIHELDAASNNSVDDIRNLIDQVRIPPQVGKYSVYIIDEVHMLSQQAFNAFLKTLEEPPPHAIFILATTEKHKIIPTILSRCQIFDFNRIQVNDIVKFLEDISQKEQVDYEKEAFTIIAQKADGAMRDALSIYDQVVSFSENKISYKNVIENLNVLDYEYYFKTTEYCMNNDIKSILLLFDEVLSEGYDAHNFMNNLSKHFRDLLVAKDKETLVLLETSANLAQKYATQATQCSELFLFKALEICNQCDIQFRTSKNQRLHVELSLLKLGNLGNEKKNHLNEPTNEDDVLDIPSASASGSTEVKEQKQEYKPRTTPSPTSEKEKKPMPAQHKSAPDVSSFSIKDALNNAYQKEEKQTAGSRNKEANLNKRVNEEILLEKWDAFLVQLTDEYPRLKTFLRNNKPLLKEGHLVELRFDNKSQVDDFKLKLKEKLLNYLWKTLENHSIQIKEIVSETEESNGNRLYTDEDKFNYLIQKNPLLKQLKQDFNLDIE